MHSLTYLSCAFLLTLSTTALAQSAPEPPVPQEQPQQPQPPGSRVRFLSTSSQAWDVTIDQQPVCATPCELYVPQLRFVALHSHEVNPVRLDVGYLPPNADLVVAAKPLENGKYAAGITFTALTGMGLVTGITLGAVGCSTDHDTMCKAGIITGVASGLGLYGSILLMKSALPKFHVGSAQPYVAGTQVGVAGRF